MVAGTYRLGGGGWPGLASGILVRAVHDWRRGEKVAVAAAQQMGFEGLESELTEFLEGRWCQELLEWLGCDGVAMGDLLLQEGYGGPAPVVGVRRRPGGRGPRG